MQGVILFIAGFLIFVILVLLIVFHKEIAKLKIFRSNAERKAERAARKAAAEEEYFRRTSNKHYREEKPSEHFDKDYFKSADEGKPKQPKQEQPKTTARATTTQGGVTIVDHRNEGASARKIFSDDEGEYVEFTEES